MILCSLLGVTAIVAPAAAQKPVPAPDPLARMNESIDALTRKVWPSVVQILVTSYGAREETRAAATPASSSAGSDRPGPDSSSTPTATS